MDFNMSSRSTNGRALRSSIRPIATTTRSWNEPIGGLAVLVPDATGYYDKVVGTQVKVYRACLGTSCSWPTRSRPEWEPLQPCRRL